MKRKSEIQMAVNVCVRVRDAKTGKTISKEKRHNKITLTGRNLTRDLLAGLPYGPTHIAAGTGSTAVSDGDTALAAEVYRDLITRRVSGSSTVSFQLFIPTTAANGNTLAEAGIFYNVSVVNTLFARTLFTAIAKTASVTVTLTWQVNLSSV